MRHTALAAVAAAIMMGTGPAAQQKPPEIALQAAIRTETAAGDLKKAIAEYEQVVKKYPVDRFVVATALVRMAECYRMLGEAQAKPIFERVVREFADQTAAADLARGRLAQVTGRDGSTGIVNRQVWTGPGVDSMGTVSPDGRYVSFTDWSTGDLAIRDLTTGTTRRLTAKEPWGTSDDYAESSAISKDGAQIAYAWYNDKTSRYELRMLKTDAAAGSSPRTVLAGPDISWLAPYDWSPDGKYVAVQVSRSKITEIGTVELAAGTFTSLRSADPQGATRLFFSPDGAHLAYDLREENSAGRDVFILGVQDRRETVVSPNDGYDLVCGWSPDGKTLLFASDRSGSLGLWAQAVTAGRPSGGVRLVKGDLGNLTSSMGVTRAGSLLYGVATGAATVTFTTIDLDKGRLTGPARPLETYVTATRQPSWSGDGRQLLTVSQNFARRRNTLTLRAADGSRPREIPATMSFLQRPRWAPDGSITIQGQDFKGAQGIFRVNTETGQVAPLILGGTDRVGQSSWAPDGKSLVYRRQGDGKGTIAIRDTQSGTDRVLLEKTGATLMGLNISRDGQTISFIESNSASRTSSLQTMPVAGGAVRELLRIAAPERLINLTEWTPDGRFILVGRNLGGTDKGSIWMVPSGGGSPGKIDGLPAAADLRLHPDGRQVAYSTGEMLQELWKLENFLTPAPTAGK